MGKKDYLRSFFSRESLRVIRCGNRCFFCDSDVEHLLTVCKSEGQKKGRSFFPCPFLPVRRKRAKRIIYLNSLSVGNFSEKSPENK